MHISTMFKRHRHCWRDVERTHDIHVNLGPHETQWILQWCETCGKYKQTKIKGSTLQGPPPLRTPVPQASKD